jgi:hypothetical protein
MIPLLQQTMTIQTHEGDCDYDTIQIYDMLVYLPQKQTFVIFDKFCLNELILRLD